ncbi:hypothetical protein [Methylobacter sp.]|uniref:hypothetical protein n=1 Tax=Methylobacter sp. TaxID=2051955 RepID=UPI003DA55AE8
MKKYALLIISFMPFMAQAAGGVWNATPVKRLEWFTNKPKMPPLNSPYQFARKTTDELNNGTSSIMALIYEQGETNNTVYPWPFYLQLDTSHDYGHAVGITSRLYNRGDGWSVAQHSEGISYGTGDTIGFNAEMSPMATSDARIIGINLNARDGYGDEHPGKWSNTAVNIQSEPGGGWAEGVRFDDGSNMWAGLHWAPDAYGTFGIKMDSRHLIVGLDTGATPTAIRMKAGSKVCLESTDAICIKYDAKAQKIYFLNGKAKLGHLNTNVQSDKCLNC